MLEQLRAWLNGKREYYAGVALLAEAGGAANVVAVLKKGETAFSSERLYKELLNICNALKSIHYENRYPGNGIDHLPEKHQAFQPQIEVPETTTPAVNGELFESCRQEALKVYKTAMNDRAILISQVTNLSAEEVNLPHFIQQRAAMALAIVRNYKNASELFDRAAHAKKHGRLPDDGEPANDQPLYDALPDDLVYTTLSNLRKAYSKLKAKEQTPERIALMQQHTANILKLEGRWRLLKGK